MTETKTKLKIRKAPKFLPFIIAGAILGIILALILDSIGTGGEDILGYLIAWLTALGAVAGIVIALIADWAFSRSAKEVEATKLEG
ncbi:MAG: hypothetical protein ACKOWE_05025 [Micrococcales bacterium]